MREIDREEAYFFLKYYCFLFCKKFYHTLELTTIPQNSDVYSLICPASGHISVWDFFDDPIVITELTGIKRMLEQNRILVTRNMELPIVELLSDEIADYCFQNDDEDLYFFNDSFSFTIVFTHEYVGKKNRRFCLLKEL